MNKPKNKKDYDKVFSYSDVVKIIIFTGTIMCFLGSVLTYKKLGGVDFTKYITDDALKKFIISYDEINKNYYTKLDSDELIDNAINAMYSGLDKYSRYMDKLDSDALTDSLNGKYEGVGIKILSDEESVKVEKVYDDSPASEAGIKEGDIILSINNTDVSYKNIDEVAENIKNGSTVNMKINRDGEVLIFNLEAKSLYVTSVRSELISYNNKSIGYIRIELFNSSTYEQFKEHLTNLENDGIESLIIDLRQNSGGYLNVCSDISQMFLKNNQTVYKLKNKNGTKVYKDKTDESRSYKIDVIIDHYSASAAEVLAATLRDNNNAKLIGMRSYGKGKVQEKVSLDDDSFVKYSTAKWLTPKGICIDEKGLKPDIEVNENTVNYHYDDKLNDKLIIAALNDLTT